MIYRIAIYCYENGQRKFDHYATDEEMKYLRVNADGKVDMADVDPYTPHEFYGWLDVSTTHEVEWGFVFEGNKYFQNDIIYNKHDKNKYLTIMWDADDCQFVIGESTDGYAGEMHLFNLPEWWTVIGNIHENPELTRGKDG